MDVLVNPNARSDPLATRPTISHIEGMRLEPARTAYRYQVDSTPKCGIIAGPIDTYADTRDEADLQILGSSERFYSQWSRHLGVAYDWRVCDRHGRLLVSATTTPNGTVYHEER